MSEWVEELEAEVQQYREDGKTYDEARAGIIADLDERIRVCKEEEGTNY